MKFDSQYMKSNFQKPPSTVNEYQMDYPSYNLEQTDFVTKGSKYKYNT